MKKLLILTIISVFGLSASAQGEMDDSSSDGLKDGFRVGLNAGIPVSKGYSDIYSFVLNADVDYDWNVSDGINAGLTSGLTYYFGKSGVDGFKYLPIAASADIEVSDGFSAGADVGYAVSLESGGGGDFLWRIQVRYQASEDVDVSARINTLSNSGASLSYISVGAGLRF